MSFSDTSAGAPFQWQQGQWDMLLKTASAGRLHHANLLAGPAGIGKLQFATRFALALVCEQFPDHAPCGACKNCQMAIGGTHPDIRFLDWQEKSTVINVEQIRNLIEKLSLTASRGGYRIAVINRANSMTVAASNSLLKTLEEPGDGCVIFLLADRDGELPITIRSRCQRLAMAVPGRDEALEWLEACGVSDASIALDVANGAPLLAREISDSENLSAIASLRHGWDEFLMREGSSTELAATTASLLGTRAAIGLFMHWTTESVKNVELSRHGGRSPIQDNPLDRRFLCEVCLTLQAALRLDNASLKTQTVLEGVLADIRINRYRNRAENAS